MSDRDNNKWVITPSFTPPQFFTPNQKDLLEVIDSEIQLIQERDQRPGWSTYAILGSIAGAIWLMIKELELPSTNVENLPALFLAFSLFIDGIRDIHAVITAQPPYSSENIRFRWSSSLKEKRTLLTYSLLRSFILIICALAASNDVSWIHVTIVCVYYLLTSVASLSALILTFRRIPLPTINDKRYLLAFKFLFAVAAIWSAYSYFISILDLQRDISFSDYHISGLLVIIVFLIQQLLSGAAEPPLLSTLINIRRDFTFGRIDLDSAMRQTDMVLVGMKVNDVLQEDVKQVLDSLEGVNTKLAAIKKSLTITRELLPTEGNKLDIELAVKLKSELTSSHPQIDELEGLLRDVNEHNSNFIQHRAAINSTLSATGDAGDLLEEKVITTLQFTRSEVGSIRDEIDVLYGQLEKGLQGLIKEQELLRTTHSDSSIT